MAGAPAFMATARPLPQTAAGSCGLTASAVRGRSGNRVGTLVTAGGPFGDYVGTVTDTVWNSVVIPIVVRQLQGPANSHRRHITHERTDAAENRLRQSCSSAHRRARRGTRVTRPSCRRVAYAQVQAEPRAVDRPLCWASHVAEWVETWLAGLDVKPKTRAAMTLDLYVHVYEDDLEALADALNQRCATARAAQESWRVRSAATGIGRKP